MWKQNILFGHRNWNILAFRGRLMSLLELRSAGSHRGLSSRRSLAYSSCWVRCLLNDSTSCKALLSLIGTEGGDSSGNSTCLKTPQSGFLEEAEAVPAESVHLQWKSTDFCTYPNIWIGKNFWDITLV